MSGKLNNEYLTECGTGSLNCMMTCLPSSFCRVSALWIPVAILTFAGCTPSKEMDISDHSSAAAGSGASTSAGAPVTWTVPPRIAPKVAKNSIQANLPKGHPHAPVEAPPGPKKIDTLAPREALLKDEIAALNGLFSKTEVDAEMHALLAREGVPQVEGSMVRIFLDRTRVNSEALSRMQGLETAHYISLYRTSIDDEGLRALANCKKLFFLDLSHTRVTDAGLEHLKGLPNLTRVVVSDTQVTSVGMATLQAALKNGWVSRNYDPR